MSELQVSDSKNAGTSQKKKRRPARSRMSIPAAAMSITDKQRQWSPEQPDEEDDEEDDLALQQQATSGPVLVSSPPFDSSESVSAGLTEIISGILKQTESAMEDLLPSINEIDSSALEIKEQLNQKRNLAMDRRAELEQTRERFQQTASSVLEMLNLAAPLMLESGLRDETGS